MQFNESKSIILILFTMAFVAWVLVDIHPPQVQERTWYEFLTMQSTVVGYPIEYLLSMSVIFATMHLMVLVPAIPKISCAHFFIAFIVFGSISILIAMAMMEISPLQFLFDLDENDWLAGFHEELSKLIASFIFSKITKNNAASTVILINAGFGMFENFFYFIGYNTVIGMRFDLGHIFFSSFWCFKFEDLMNSNCNFLTFLIYLGIGMLVHAAWNTFLINSFILYAASAAEIYYFIFHVLPQF